MAMQRGKVHPDLHNAVAASQYRKGNQVAKNYAQQGAPKTAIGRVGKRG